MSFILDCFLCLLLSLVDISYYLQFKYSVWSIVSLYTFYLAAAV